MGDYNFPFTTFYWFLDMGNIYSQFYYTPGAIIPDTSKPPTFDPNYGFEKPRPLRKEPKTTPIEMENMGIPLDQRDYCVDELIEFITCKHKHGMLGAWRCKMIKHKYDDCGYNDRIHSMMEYERERRLLVREQMKKELAQAAAKGETVEGYEDYIEKLQSS